VKREIPCVSCADSLRRTFATIPETPGEHHKFVGGKSKQSCRCDHCFGKIPVGSECRALSIWADGSPAPYYKWEDAYVGHGEKPDSTLPDYVDHAGPKTKQRRKGRREVT
jgi:hypothetical protein